jgi:hypothetical protein
MNQRSIAGLIKYCLAPLVLFFALLMSFLLSALKVIPPFEILVEILFSLFDKYGSLIVGPASFFENLAIANFIFPGSIVILTAMALTAGNLLKASWTFLFIWLGSLLGLIGSFVLGKILSRYGMQKSTLVKGKSLAWQAAVTFWHPQFASMMCFSLGSNNVRLRSVAVPLLVINLLWNLFWGVLIYNVGPIFKDAETIKYLLVAVLLLWLSWRFYKWHQKSIQ